MKILRKPGLTCFGNIGNLLKNKNLRGGQPPHHYTEGRTTMKNTEKEVLYKAVKYQVANYYADHGMNLAEMWHTIHSDTKNGDFWKSECLRDFAVADK